MPPLLSVCVPTLDVANGRAKRLLASVARHTWYSWEGVVEDCRGKLRGYTEPMNAAMSRARGSYLLAVNDDVEVSPGWLDPLLEALEDPGVWCATPDATHTDGPQIFAPWCMLWKPQAWDELGALDEQFRFWCSDIDLARRMVDAGHPPVRVKLPVPVTHQLNATANEHPAELNAMCLEDLDRFRRKWGVDAESEKYRLAALVA